MLNLTKILKQLKEHSAGSVFRYYIPEAWNCCGFQAFRTTGGRTGEILVDPYAFMAHNITYLLESAETGNQEGKAGNPLSGEIVFGMLPRMFTAWPHGEDGRFVSGTFLKTICLIPYLKKMNVSIIYLLPIFKHSDKYRKGSLGSPYAIKNIYGLDEHLHDELLGDYSEELLDTELKAFIEACHLWGIKVMVDFVFRTVARDSDLILSHPDWFYWIDAAQKDRFCIPPVENEKEHTSLSDKSLPSLYRSKGIEDYLASFRPAPNAAEPARWAEVAGRCQREGGNILDYAEKYFGVSTVPGFSDVINDHQPPWSDVTYLRYYFDVHKKARTYLSKDQAPYILQDGVKLNLYRGDEKNAGLWEYIAGVIPYYQKQYGIDGARIDMGHALPPELNREIIAGTKRQAPDFILWSEEFDVKNAGQAREDGFHFITGTVWMLYKEICRPNFGRKLLKPLMASELPVTGALETPDTPRSAYVYPDRRLLRLLVWLNCFLPNAVTFINNGQELMEVQPMNLGLDNTEAGRFVLDEGDPMYGRLAFFDRYILHWLGKDRQWMTELLVRATGLRKHFSPLMTDGRNFVAPIGAALGGKLLYLCYCRAETGENVFLLANRSLKRKKTAVLSDFAPEAHAGEVSGCRLLYRSSAGAVGLHEKLVLSPGEVVIGQFIFKE